MKAKAKAVMSSFNMISYSKTWTPSLFSIQ